MPNDYRYVRIAALRPSLHADGGMANLVLIRQLVESILAEAPLDIVVLPESFDGVSTPSAGAITADDARKFLSHLARGCNTAVVGGSVVTHDGGDRPRNTCFVFDRTGELMGRYDKRALFHTEADRREPGDAAPVFVLDGVRVGVLICADLWRPEYARSLAGRIDVLCVPAKTGVPTEPHTVYATELWHNLALTRAMENGFAVAVADWSARRHDIRIVESGAERRLTYYTAGAACIVNPGHRPNIDAIWRRPKQPDATHIRTDINLAKLDAYRTYRENVGLLPPNPHTT